MNTPSRRNSLSSLIVEKGIFVSRSGALHTVVSIEARPVGLKITTGCGQCIQVRDSRRSRASRWLRKGWMRKLCKDCKRTKQILSPVK